MSDKVENAQNMLHQINESIKHCGMEINREKTKSMLVADKQYKLDIKIDDSTIEQVSKFQYLGVQVTSDNYSAVDIRSRLVQGMAALQKLESIWRGKKVSLITKMRLLDSNVIPLATYRCETWTS